jgi:hypothetical protein
MQAAPGQHVRGEYQFAASNPFLGDPAALEKGKDLFKRGLLSEAALALEAEVRHGVLVCMYGGAGCAGGLLCSRMCTCCSGALHN